MRPGEAWKLYDDYQKSILKYVEDVDPSVDEETDAIWESEVLPGGKTTEEILALLGKMLEADSCELEKKEAESCSLKAEAARLNSQIATAQAMQKTGKRWRRMRSAEFFWRMRSWSWRSKRRQPTGRRQEFPNWMEGLRSWSSSFRNMSGWRRRLPCRSL